MSLQLFARSSSLGSRASVKSLISSIISKPAQAASILSASPPAALINRFFFHRALSSVATLSTRFPGNSPPVRAFSTRPVSSSLNDANPNWSNRPPKETILLDGCDFEHWLVVMEKPEGDPTRAEIIDSYIKTLAMVVGSEEEARMKIYSVSTRCYFAFGALVSEELSYKLKELPRVRWVLPDSYLNVREKDYGGEPFINGEAVPYDPKYHEEWERNNQRAMERNRRNDRPRNTDRSRNFNRNRNMQYQDSQSSPSPPIGPNHGPFQPPNPSSFPPNQGPRTYPQYNSPPNFPPSQQMPSSPQPHQQMPGSPPPHQQMPGSPPPHQQMPSSPPPHQQMPISPPTHQRMPSSPLPHQQMPNQQMSNFPPPHQQMTNFPPPHQQMANPLPPHQQVANHQPPQQQMYGSQQPNQASFQHNQGGYPANSMTNQNQGRYPQNNVAPPRQGGYNPSQNGYQQNQDLPSNQSSYQAGQNYQNGPSNPTWNNSSRQNYQDGYSPDRD